MTSLAHIISPFDAPDTSDLKVAQPITFESMRVARQMAQGRIEVRQFSTYYEEDATASPADFESAGLLERSILDVGSFSNARKLPLLHDILERLYAASEGSDYLIYTNVDIALMPSFYLTVGRLIDKGFDAFVINRRTISDRYTDLADLPLMYAQAGEPHQGWDCFVFPRERFPKYRIGLVCLGAPFVGRVLLLNLIAFSERFKELKGLHATFHLGNDRAWDEEKFADLANFNRGQGAELMDWLETQFDTSDRDGVLARYISQSRKWLERHTVVEPAKKTRPSWRPRRTTPGE